MGFSAPPPFTAYDASTIAQVAHPAKYINEHVAPVAGMAARRHGTNSDEEIVAWLHDVMEDCPEWTAERLGRAFAPPHIILALKFLTHRKDQSYTSYITAIASNRLARSVKLCDLAQNRDRCATDPKRKHQKDKYELAIELLTNRE